MSGHRIVLIISLVINVFNFGNGARILAICPTVSISHQVVVRGLALALNNQGHELVVVTTDPLNDPNLKNYTEIDFSYMYDGPIFYDNNYIDKRGKQDISEVISQAGPLIYNQVEEMLGHPELRKLYAPNSTEKFDLILLEIFWWHAFLPLGVRFDAPIIGITSFGLSLHTQWILGNPISSSNLGIWEVDTKVFGSFIPWQRLDNFIRVWRYIYYFETDWLPRQETIAKKYFGDEIPSLRELYKNISLIFVNQQLPISFARPNLPNIVAINSFHISKPVEPLPKDLQQILDEATQGFVYMNLGSNVKSTMMSDKLRGEFVLAFSKLPYQIIWKFENDNFPDKPDNVMVMKWAPQEAILAHPNIKVFIYQGGAQSTEEAVFHAVPLIGLPVFGDQDMQVDKMVSIGVARKLEITTINSNDLLEAINDVATDSGYKQRMMSLRALMEDRPYDLRENAVWWTEHVIRHRGAPYLRSNFADEPWYQRQDIDIIAFLSVGFMIVLSIALIIFYKLLFSILRILTVYSSDKKIKVN